MIPASWTDVSTLHDEKHVNKAAYEIAAPMIVTINDLTVLRQKVDFLLKRGLTIQKEKTNACRTDDPNGSHGTNDRREATME
jgi:hypothetical protein